MVGVNVGVRVVGIPVGVQVAAWVGTGKVTDLVLLVSLDSATRLVEFGCGGYSHPGTAGNGEDECNQLTSRQTVDSLSGRNHATRTVRNLECTRILVSTIENDDIVLQYIGTCRIGIRRCNVANHQIRTRYKGCGC